MDLSHLPFSPWVYFFKKNSGKILYIWKAKNIKKRVEQYFNKDIWVWKEDMVSKADFVDFVITNSDQEAYILEKNLVQKYQPKYNTLLKWDNSYTYIKITNEDFPQIFFTRFKQSDGALYIWPKVYKKELKKLLHILRQFFQFRGCNKTTFQKWVLCGDYTFWLCKWWCSRYLEVDENNQIQINKKAPEDKQSIKARKENLQKKYQEIINNVINFFEWKTEKVENKILDEINRAIQIENYERAARLRDIYQNIRKFTSKQGIELSETITWNFFKIKHIGGWFVFAIAKFYNWKLIDIVKFKESDSDNTFSELKNSFEHDFGKLKFYKKTTNYSIGWSKDFNALPKTVFEDIDWLLENLIQSLIISSSFEKENVLSSLLEILQERYFLKNYPYKMECVDISHFSGDYKAWGLSCLMWWIPTKKFYRMYSISKEGVNNDYASLEEVLTRRFKSKNTLPDLLVIDWWKWQLWVLKKLIKTSQKFSNIFNKVDFISIWKWKAKVSKKDKEKIYYFDCNFNIREKTMIYDDADKVLLKLRDESHRFANRYRKKKMSKKRK